MSELKKVFATYAERNGNGYVDIYEFSDNKFIDCITGGLLPTMSMWEDLAKEHGYAICQWFIEWK